MMSVFFKKKVVQETQTPQSGIILQWGGRETLVDGVRISDNPNLPLMGVFVLILVLGPNGLFKVRKNFIQENDWQFGLGGQWASMWH